MPRNCAHKGCNDFRQTSEATRRRWLGSSLTRRQVLGAGLGFGLSVYAARAMPLARMLEAAEAEAAAAPDAPVLVTVFLPGGCDLLNTFVPLGDFGRYADLRKHIRVDGAPALGGSGLGIHPSLTTGARGGIRGLYEAGKLGLLPGVDYANPDLSHFHSRHFWETGLITQDAAPGWLGRWLDRHGSGDNALQGLSLDYSLSPVLRSGGAPVAALTSPADAKLYINGTWGRGQDDALATWDRISASYPRAPGPAATFGAARLAKQVGDRLGPDAGPGRGRDGDVPGHGRQRGGAGPLSGLLRAGPRGQPPGHGRLPAGLREPHRAVARHLGGRRHPQRRRVRAHPTRALSTPLPV